MFSHIAYLLRHHDCVVLPGIGAFVAISHGARLDCESNRFFPPHREITFNSVITHDDGLVSWSIARRRGIPFEQASAIASQLFSDLTHRLHLEGAVDMGRIGTLHRHSDGRISFVPRNNYSSAVLPELKLKPFVAAPVLSLQIEHRSHERTVAVVRVPLRRRLIAAVASIAALLILGFALSTPIDVTTAHMASLTGPAFTPPRVEKIEPLPEPQGLRLAMAMPDASTSILQVMEKPAPKVPARYVMVVASLPNRSIAEKYIAEHSDTRLHLLEKDGKFRVYITTGTTQAEVMEQAAAIEGFSASYPDAWVCRK